MGKKPAKLKPPLQMIEERKHALGFKSNGYNPKERIHCKRCDKEVYRIDSRKGYCLACVQLAAKAKAARERDQHEIAEKYTDTNFGVF